MVVAYMLLITKIIQVYLCVLPTVIKMQTLNHDTFQYPLLEIRAMSQIRIAMLCGLQDENIMQ